MSRKRSFDLVAQENRSRRIGVRRRNDIDIAHPGLHDIDAKISFGGMIVIIAKSKGDIFLQIIFEASEELIPLIFKRRIIPRGVGLC